MTAAPRPSPEALLKAAKREARGRLKIFLGAAPGVGKTFEMLREGAELLRSGADVVVGVVETHGRAETEALIAPFAVLPRQTIAHGQHKLAEFDLDAMLARRPAVALIDELAHTNAPGSRHPKRWQDIEELRDAGIDVLTTVNVQHVESLNDVVAGFTRVRVRETVPDAVLDDAEIEIVDLPPDELIERLKAGKIYIPQEATRALGHFFSKSNLSALRELALRRAAQTVDRHLLEHVASVGEQGTWAGGERVVVAVGDQPGGESLIRAAKRLADALHAPWTAVSVETPRNATLGPAGRARLAEALKLANSLGAMIATVPAHSVFDGLCAHIRETRATAVVIGKSQRSWWFELRHGSVVDRLVRALDGVAVHVVPVAEAVSSVVERPAARPVPTRGIIIGLAFVALTTVVAVGVQPWVGANSIDLIYLLPVIATATLFGLRSSLVATLCATLAYNFLFSAAALHLHRQRSAECGDIAGADHRRRRVQPVGRAAEARSDHRRAHRHGKCRTRGVRPATGCRLRQQRHGAGGVRGSREPPRRLNRIVRARWRQAEHRRGQPRQPMDRADRYRRRRMGVRPRPDRRTRQWHADRQRLAVPPARDRARHSRCAGHRPSGPWRPRAGR